MLVITGYPFPKGRKTEIQDLIDPAFTCPGVQDFPIDMNYGSGGLIDGIPIVCGGRDYDQLFEECHTLQETG